ncbi:succinate dehydrogenase / fumarate reductase cytochrome b subunit [Roseivirga pacifica]|uniref:Succinate dehydrogenase / fumarate reductase cytochrome b subunit n=2 Tax=Roseivirga pacifica TaxID=1267423 RepID=A0A1I0RM98_9BACT|nr:succinate dehydrogenase cytochrome b subunit [Roseivirga pacifica]RKQ49857.1 succinate dehydrogenase / fumarate reductase cytochrome b subunit [Roseivirga pacifica]SEW42244.1 succinate dehydrogenase / fumarate reductase cytochrome b subunit [Roseivirga pacifica]
MSWMKQTFNSSIGRKFAMALSALFLMFFLLQHFAINFTSVFSEQVFNDLSHFMGTNPLVQFALQPILIFGVVYHFVMGFVLEAKNRNARAVKYAKNNGAANSTWFSRNMIYSGMVILLFLAVHFYDFWIPEISTKYIQGDMSGLLANGEFRYYEEMVEKFHDPIRTGIYVLAFVFLALHLMHGFQSAFQSVGARHNKYTPAIQKLGKLYAIVIPAGFIFIALFHHLTGH